MLNKQNLTGKLAEVCSKSFVVDQKTRQICIVPPGTIALVLSHKNNSIVARIISCDNERNYDHAYISKDAIIETINPELIGWKVLRTDANRAQDPNVLL